MYELLVSLGIGAVVAGVGYYLYSQRATEREFIQQSAHELGLVPETDGFSGIRDGFAVGIRYFDNAGEHTEFTVQVSEWLPNGFELVGESAATAIANATGLVDDAADADDSFSSTFAVTAEASDDAERWVRDAPRDILLDFRTRYPRFAISAGRIIVPVRGRVQHLGEVRETLDAVIELAGQLRSMAE